VLPSRHPIFFGLKTLFQRACKNFLTWSLKLGYRGVDFRGTIRMKEILGLKRSNWWCWEKKDAEVCPAPL
jgi:hypothetical protein